MTKREKKAYDAGGHKTQQVIMEGVMDRKKKHTRGGRWRNWEKGRKKALRERRDYFRKHPDKKDDFSGV